MEKPCKDCPWVMEERGQGYLSEERMEGLRFGAAAGQAFHCHKSVYQKGVEMEEREDGEEPPSWHPKYRQCAGANQYALRLAKELGIEPQVIGKPFQKKAGG